MNRRSFLRLISASTLACALPSAGHSDSEGRGFRPNVLFIAIDDLNDWIEPLGGHPQAKTPNLNRLAGKGVVFTSAYCPAPACLSSRAALMSGKASPIRIGDLRECPGVERRASRSSNNPSVLHCKRLFFGRRR
jgi:arylsulfatase A-like enzyme